MCGCGQDGREGFVQSNYLKIHNWCNLSYSLNSLSADIQHEQCAEGAWLTLCILV